jgi:hypothetical protein
MTSFCKLGFGSAVDEAITRRRLNDSKFCPPSFAKPHERSMSRKSRNAAAIARHRQRAAAGLGVLHLTVDVDATAQAFVEAGLDEQGGSDASLNVHADAPLSSVQRFLAKVSDEIDARYAPTIERLASDLEDSGFSAAQIEREVDAYAKRIAMGREEILRDVIQVIEEVRDELRHERC